jgi:class 3 adenylate cyclase
MSVSLSVRIVHPRKLAAVRREVAQGEIGSAWGPAVEKVWDFIHTQPGLWGDGHNIFRAVRCVSNINRSIAIAGVPIRAGLHTGEVELRDDDIGGIAVHIASRISGLATGGQILASRTVKDLVAGSGISFRELGEYTLKGVPDSWQIYEAFAN